MNSIIKMKNNEVAIKGDYNSYRTHFLYRNNIKNGSIGSLKVRGRDDLSSYGEVTYVDSMSQLIGHVAYLEPQKSIVIPTKDSGVRWIDVYNNKGEKIKNLLDYCGLSITEEGHKNTQKTLKRLKRIFRQTRYGKFLSKEYQPSVKVWSDDHKTYDGLIFASTPYLNRLGVPAQDMDRFSFTYLEKSGMYKGHLLALDGLDTDVLLIGKPVKEIAYNGDQFLQLDPVEAKNEMRMDIQTLTSMLMCGIVNIDTMLNWMKDGLNEVNSSLLELPKPSDAYEVEAKYVKFQLVEASILTPRMVTQKYEQIVKSLISNNNKLKFFIPGITGYLSPLFEVHDGFPVLMRGESIVYDRGNFMVPVNMMDEFKQKHGGADCDDRFCNPKKEKGQDKGILFRSPNIYSEIERYHIVY